MRKSNHREIVLLLLPVLVLLVLGLGFYQHPSPPPVFDSIVVAPVSPEMREWQSKLPEGAWKVDAVLTVNMRYQPPTLFGRCFGWGVDERTLALVEGEMAEFLMFDAAGHNITPLSGDTVWTQSGLYYQGADVFSHDYEFSSKSLLPPTGRVTCRMKIKVRDRTGKSWVLPASGTLRER